MLKGIFGRGPKRPEPTVAIAMVALESAVCPDSNAVISVLKTLHPDIVIRGAERTGDAVSLDIAGVTAMYALMPMPIPRGDLEWPLRAAMFAWADAEASFERHPAHLIVHVGSQERDRLDVWLLLTHLVTAVVQASPALGVYWGAGSLVHEPRRFVAAARKGTRREPPLELWIGIHPIQGETGTSMFTTGLDAFGTLNLEVRDSKRDVGDLLELFAGTMHYLVTTGATLSDGDTLGSSESERLRVVHARSAFVTDRPVCLIEV